jgi:hypothetical protein
MEQSRNKKGSWAYVVPQEMNGLVDDLSFIRNRIGWGYGSGILAVVNGTHTNDDRHGQEPGQRDRHGDDEPLPVRRYDSGMFVAFTDRRGATIKAVATITAINTNGLTARSTRRSPRRRRPEVVVAQSPTQTSLNKEPEGLLAGIDDGTYVGTYHGLSRTTYPMLQSPVFSSVGSLSADAIQQCDRRGRHQGRQDRRHVPRELGVLRAYLAMTELDRRYTGADLMRPDAGTRGEEADGKKARSPSATSRSSRIATARTGRCSASTRARGSATS